MTGFGKGEATLQNKRITVEIRSLNSKQLDLSLRLPAVYRQSEYELRNVIARTIQRGKVDVFVSVESQSVETSARINREVFREYLRQMNDTLAFAGIDADYDAILPVIMRLPDVVATESEAISEEEHAALIAAAEAAAAQLDAFRTQEGAILIADLLRRVELIERYRDEVVPFEKARTETIRTRILDNLAKLPVEVDRNRLEQEMIFYLEKLDITEEKVRLTNHCKYFREVAAGEEGAGRKLGFIAQEMGREINTMGSKANESNIQILVVKMKDELEKIKEQVLNIL
ncbi:MULTISPECIES: YicC/YloC family endoribonuclease [Alistipes]|uniref:YicC family protein n=4 Tax=Alistipes TaxID=239759 RepID=A0ABY5VB16_9BACT|nr:YicC/YloC family endoribonuclease [Alistipes senegalensis]MCI7307501.1 YicC family protein [Alistipes senegalensis]MDD7040051.1 YicC family protein [Alistipes senegalensis]MDY2875405.1 YicC/YloC family endoribonuclease [Alistipes senegalensis]MDY4570758.1 YicC/YloC family endoribonuclease [Alistipes senegalensis]MDY5241811.1 YicC/YloC family endoribonuclease [Alistipes senegalensis]